LTGQIKIDRRDGGERVKTKLTKVIEATPMTM
jgi:hypothetical protein